MIDQKETISLPLQYLPLPPRALLLQLVIAARSKFDSLCLLAVHVGDLSLAVDDLDTALFEVGNGVALHLGPLAHDLVAVDTACLAHALLLAAASARLVLARHLLARHGQTGLGDDLALGSVLGGSSLVDFLGSHTAALAGDTLGCCGLSVLHRDGGDIGDNRYLGVLELDESSACTCSRTLCIGSALDDFVEFLSENTALDEILDALADLGSDDGHKLANMLKVKILLDPLNVLVIGLLRLELDRLSGLATLELFGRWRKEVLVVDLVCIHVVGFIINFLIFHGLVLAVAFWCIESHVAEFCCANAVCGDLLTLLQLSQSLFGVLQDTTNDSLGLLPNLPCLESINVYLAHFQNILASDSASLALAVFFQSLLLLIADLRGKALEGVLDEVKRIGRDRSVWLKKRMAFAVGEACEKSQDMTIR
ncbi:hypothetical protein HG530_013367 [Fusarium avenaceum]|nr:hypothetical protein HG530_013367 [Fusarium avenaceum]